MMNQLRLIFGICLLILLSLPACAQEKSAALPKQSVTPSSIANLIIHFGDRTSLEDMRLKLFVRGPYCVSTSTGHSATPDDLKQWILQDTNETVYDLDVESTTSALDLAFVVKQFEAAARQPNVHHSTVLNILVTSSR